MNIKIVLAIVFSYALIMSNCMGGFVKIPKNINSFPIDRSYRLLYNELTQKYGKDSTRIKQVSIYSQIVNGYNFNFIFAIEDLITQSVFLGQSLVQFDNSNKKAELNGYSFFSQPNFEVSEIKRKEIKTSIERIFKGQFTVENYFELDNILGYNYYVAFGKNAIEQKKYYIFSQQVDKEMEYELEGLFVTSEAFKATEDIRNCCCLNDSNKWEIYPVSAEERKCPDLRSCTVSLNDEFCRKQ